MAKTREEKNAYQRAYRLKTKNGCTKKYERSPNGFLMRAYRNLKSRCLGLVKPHLYKGLPFLEKEEFYEWSRNNADFWNLYRNWVRSGYEHRLSPSVNRIDPSHGYIPGNIEWVTHSVNSSLGSRSSRRSPTSAIRRALRVET